MSRGPDGNEAISLPLRWISATLSKAGHRPEENEDAIAISPRTLRFAVADGATEGWESGPWATCLAKAYARLPPTPPDFPAWLTVARRRGATPGSNGPTPWYAEVKRAEGSFATLVGVEFRFSQQASRWTWRAVAIGDSCLFQIRGGRVDQVFPITTVSGFGNRPQLVPSLLFDCPEPDWLAGKAEPMDLFLLVTDAVAAHLMALATPADWSPILALIEKAVWAGDSGPILKWFRTVQAVKNDDLSMIAIRVPSAPNLLA